MSVYTALILLRKTCRCVLTLGHHPLRKVFSCLQVLAVEAVAVVTRSN